MEAVEHGKRVLSAVLHGRKDLLELVLRRLTPEHFQDATQRDLFLLAERYLDTYGLLLTREAVEDLLRSRPPGDALAYGEYIDALLAIPPDGEAINWHIDQLRELADERQTGEALAQAMEILQRGATHEQVHLQGARAARKWAMTRFAELDRTFLLQDAPEGDMRAEEREILEGYARRARHQREGYAIVSTGFEELDKAMGGGFQPGELVLVAGNTNVGKSSLLAQWAWDACVRQGKNVVIFTSETNRTQMRYKIVARHSRYLVTTEVPPGSWPAQEFPQGLDTVLLRSGLLPGRGGELLAYVVKDFTTQRRYGRCYVAQVPAGATIATISARLARVARMFRVDLVGIDYLALLRSDRKRQQKHEELSYIVIGAKELAHSFDDGRGVPLVSPWQMNREGVKAAVDRGYYTTADLAATAESSNTADAIFGLLQDGDDTSAGRRARIKLGVVKLRDGVKLRSPIMLEADYATATYTPLEDGRDGPFGAVAGGEAVF